MGHTGYKIGANNKKPTQPGHMEAGMCSTVGT